MTDKINDTVVPFHAHREYQEQCIDLLNSEWPQSRMARIRYLEKSCDELPVALLFLQENHLIGHSCICSIPGRPKDCWVQSVVIDKTLRGRGLGKRLMLATEQYAKEKLGIETMYLSTHDKQAFYEHVGYELCPPVFNVGSSAKLLNDERFRKFTESISNATSTPIVKEVTKSQNDSAAQTIPLPTTAPPVPPPPPLPVDSNVQKELKIVYMKKRLVA